MSSSTLFGSHKAESFVGRGLDGYLLRRNIQDAGNVCQHIRNIRGDLRSFQHDRGVNVDDGKSMLLQQIADMLQKQHAGNSPIAGIGVGEVLPDVAKTCSAEESIHDGVEQDIGVRMPVETFVVWNVHSSEGELPSPGKTVNVVSETNP